MTHCYHWVAVHARLHRPARDPTRVEVEHDRQVQPTLVGAPIGDIRDVAGQLSARANTLRIITFLNTDMAKLARALQREGTN